jgi:hypothetical protein
MEVSPCEFKAETNPVRVLRRVKGDVRADVHTLNVNREARHQG